MVITKIKTVRRSIRHYNTKIKRKEMINHYNFLKGLKGGLIGKITLQILKLKGLKIHLIKIKKDNLKLLNNI